MVVVDSDDAINIIFCKELEAAKDKKKKRDELTKEYRDKFANPYVAAGLGYIDKVIFPRETRPLICKGLDMLASKRQSRPPKKHGNIPLYLLYPRLKQVFQMLRRQLVRHSVFLSEGYISYIYEFLLGYN
jgi:hypothetical protein